MSQRFSEMKIYSFPLMKDHQRFVPRKSDLSTHHNPLPKTRGNVVNIPKAVLFNIPLNNLSFPCDSMYLVHVLKRSSVNSFCLVSVDK